MSDDSKIPPFKRLLLATEGTEFDVGAERVAIALAKSCDLPLHVVLPIVSNAEAASIAPESEEKIEAVAATKMGVLKIAATDAGVAFAGTVRTGTEPMREIIDAAREQRADLIILRRRGKRSYLANLLLGEMVHAVITHAPCDVLIVPRASPLWSKAILVATDGSPHSERAAAVAAAIAAHHGLPLTVVSVGDAADSNAQTHVDIALAIARDAGAQVVGRAVGAGKPHEVILEAAAETGADLIVIGRRGLSRIERVLLGSTSERTAGAANSPVLIVQQPQMLPGEQPVVPAAQSII